MTLPSSPEMSALPAPDPPAVSTDATERSFLLPLAGGLAVLGGAAILAADAFLVEPRSPGITRQDLSVPDLPSAWEGATVLHISDLHYGNPWSERLFRWLTEQTRELDPDLIVCTGDFVVRRPWEAQAVGKHLPNLHSRRGVFAVLGDHDFVHRKHTLISGVLEAIEGAGIRLLRNDAVELPGGLRIAGVEPGTNKVDLADLDAALRPLNGKLPHLLLSHAPDIIPEAARRSVPLVLCGHTHGGQVVVPLYGPPITHSRVHRRHASGWSEYGPTRMFCVRGLASHYSLRFLCRPEIALFTLRAATP